MTATTEAAFREPNLFELEGDKTNITYSTTSITGVPQFNYQDHEISRSFNGPEIRTLEAEIGRLVTVTLDQVPDLQTTTATLLLPTINLPQGATESPIETVAILSIERTSIGGPGLVQGQPQAYRTLNLKGRASLVAF